MLKLFWKQIFCVYLEKKRKFMLSSPCLSVNENDLVCITDLLE